MPQKRHEPRSFGPAALELRELKRLIAVDARKGKLSIKALRAKYDCSGATIRSLLDDDGAPFVRWTVESITSPSPERRHPKVVDRAPAGRFFADARRGLMTRQELAAKYGMSYGRACALIRDANIALPRKPWAPRRRVAAALGQRLLRIVSLREQGKTLHEIGLRYGLTRERVRQILGSEDALMARYVAAPMAMKSNPNPPPRNRKR